ncbi:hypothetical protein D770_09010 [Flammeovirgaceae bacterium 311]|nr:hypothetical protein D770_09010 [Flammeovirgaceae bacterium 311]
MPGHYSLPVTGTANKPGSVPDTDPFLKGRIFSNRLCISHKLGRKINWDPVHQLIEPVPGIDLDEALLYNEQYYKPVIM